MKPSSSSFIVAIRCCSITARLSRTIMMAVLMVLQRQLMLPFFNAFTCWLQMIQLWFRYGDYRANWKISGENGHIEKWRKFQSVSHQLMLKTRSEQAFLVLKLGQHRATFSIIAIVTFFIRDVIKRSVSSRASAGQSCINLKVDLLELPPLEFQ